MKKVMTGGMKVAAIFISLFFLGACAEEDEHAGSASRISFAPMTFKEMDATTRAAQAGTGDITAYGISSAVCPAASSFTSVGCGSYFYNERIVAAEGTCKYFWPGSSYKVSFFAYRPYGNDALTLSSAATRNGYPQYDYTVPTAVTSQLDVMTADVTDRSAAPTDVPVALNFQHRCSDIRFNVRNQHPTQALTLKSITIVGMKYAGTYCEGSSPKWTLTGYANTEAVHPFIFSPNVSIAANTTTDVTGTSNHFMVLPQTVAAGTSLMIFKTTEYGVEKTYTYTLSAAFTFSQGLSYIFNITVGDGLLTVDPDTEVSEWETTVTYLNGAVTANEPGRSGQTTQETSVSAGEYSSHVQNISGTITVAWLGADGQWVTNGAIGVGVYSPTTQQPNGSVTVGDYNPEIQNANNSSVGVVDWLP